MAYLNKYYYTLRKYFSFKGQALSKEKLLNRKTTAQECKKDLHKVIMFPEYYKEVENAGWMILRMKQCPRQIQLTFAHR